MWLWEKAKTKQNKKIKLETTLCGGHFRQFQSTSSTSIIIIKLNPHWHYYYDDNNVPVRLFAIYTHKHTQNSTFNHSPSYIYFTKNSSKTILLMGNSLRCCLACVLPCGALDLIRIVHLNGYVEEITRPITAGEVLKANPNHVLSKPTSQGVVRRILILSPETELKRGSIYFLIPSSSLPPEKRRRVSQSTAGDDLGGKKALSSMKSKSRECCDVSDDNKKCLRRDRRHGRGGVWRPQLEIIIED